jgi:hypothetical protein
VVANQMAFRLRPSDDIRIALSAFANYEERGAYSLFLEDIEQLGRAYRVGTIVKGKGHAAPSMAVHTPTVFHKPLVAGMK